MELFLFVINLVIVVYAWVRLWKAPDTRGPKWMWFFIILFLEALGAVLFLIFGTRGRQTA
ncbi:phospholipase D-like protein [Melghirimyces profundicolus]|uniref:Phospholipase D-like protein n=1 Tax=Melghirimyces profundicolus TaxID=1242148 RepID=A0A2T6BXJ4_9BACL|nr:PLDc N-terminal domain-containing protein [Melghirimyces profundicolus]PTX60785.1 phospholipase D-like protein [Melghirimyces profundicolus]